MLGLSAGCSDAWAHFIISLYLILYVFFIKASLLHALWQDLNIVMKNKSYIGTLSQRTLLLMIKVTCVLQTSVLQESGGPKTLKIHQELQDTWLRKLCADKIIQLLLIILLSELWLLSVCLAKDHIKESLEKRLEIIFSRNKFKSRKVIYPENPMNGLLKPPISSIK